MRRVLATGMAMATMHVMEPSAHAAATMAQAVVPTSIPPDALTLLIQAGGFGMSFYFVWWVTGRMTKAIEDCTQVMRRVEAKLDRRHNESWDGRTERRQHRRENDE